jgi:ATP-dependent protease Clp ATPase subunit
MKPRNAYCSFCRKSYQDVGPLFEGPGDVYICSECVELCQSIIEQEKRRRNPRQPSAIGPEELRQKLDQIVANQDEAKSALVAAASRRRDGAGHVLLIGANRSSKILLARALAHALEVPFAAGEASGMKTTNLGKEEILPVLYHLLLASDFDIELAQHGVVYVDGFDLPETQQSLHRLWQKTDCHSIGDLQFYINQMLFVCGATLPGLNDSIASSGRHSEQPITGEALAAFGVRAELFGCFSAIARVGPIDEETLGRLVHCFDFSRLDSGSATQKLGQQEE